MMYRTLIVDLPPAVTEAQYEKLLLLLEEIGVTTFRTPFGDNLSAAKLQIIGGGKITGAQG